jgi:predicted ATP-dependent endonuclease of OLD family
MPLAVTPGGRVGVSAVRVRGFRSLRDATLRPGAVCALVGEANAGKSNLLAALRALLDASSPPPTLADATIGGDGLIRVEAQLAEGEAELWLDGDSAAGIAAQREHTPPVVYVPSELRATAVAAPSADPVAREIAVLLQRGVGDALASSATVPAQAFVAGIDACCAERVAGAVLLVEEPELFLRPQAQRYLYRALRRFALSGNQVIYSTHAPAFLNVGRLEELALVRHDRHAGTLITQPSPLPTGDDFKALAAFDAERSELFLSRCAVLVEGRTEKLTLPFVFEALGADVDREAISVVDCGGKANLPLFARICRTAEVPFVAVHDRDSGGHADRKLNSLIAETAGAGHTFTLDPDFETAAGLRRGGRKPEHAWRRFQRSRERIPQPLLSAAERAIELARG